MHWRYSATSVMSTLLMSAPPPHMAMKIFYRHCQLFPEGQNHPGLYPIYEVAD